MYAAFATAFTGLLLSVHFVPFITLSKLLNYEYLCIYIEEMEERNAYRSAISKFQQATSKA